MKRAFLSHGWCDADLVSQFGEAVEQNGVQVFLDKWDIRSGAMIWTTIDKAIDEASQLVLFLSRDSLSGRGVREELDRGLQKAYEKHGEVFMIPVALDRIEDIARLLPIRVRGANMIRAFELGFPESVAALKSAILDEPLARRAVTMPTDFYYRTYQLGASLVVELGTGLPVQEGFGFETVWSEPVRFVSAGMGSPRKPSAAAWEQGMWVTTHGFYIPQHPDTRLCPAYGNRSIRRGESFYIRVVTSDGRCPNAPAVVRLYDKFHQLVRDSVARYPEV